MSDLTIHISERARDTINPFQLSAAVALAERFKSARLQIMTDFSLPQGHVSGSLTMASASNTFDFGIAPDGQVSS